jgi:hypothetical protein
LTATDLLYYQETDSDIIDNLGTHCFVSKPVDNEDFVRRLERILSQLDSKKLKAFTAY